MTNYRIAPELRLILIKNHGAVSKREAVEIVRAVHGDVLFRPDYDVLNDSRDLGTGLNFTDIEELADMAKENCALHPVRNAILVASPLAYGISRMWASLSDGYNRHQVGIFESLEEVCQWLERPVDLVRDALAQMAAGPPENA